MSHDPSPKTLEPPIWPWWSYAVAAAVVTAAAIWVTWPLASGVMPRSADHQVHLARAHQWWSVLATGHARGWSDRWFFGTPVGELYPPLADLLVIGLRALSLGRASWEGCYAVAFVIAFTVQGWAMLRAGRAFGLGPVPGLVAGLLILLDPGWSREGGWMYTVWFGVWPQVLANALCWLAFAELALACAPARDATTDVRRLRGLALAGLWLGLALLAHPIVLPMAVLGLPTLAIVLAVKRGTGGRRFDALWETLARAGFVFVVALAISAWWLLPMLEHRAWMASYGWLHDPLARLAQLATQGQWTRRMPAAAGYAAAAGIVFALVPAFFDEPRALHGHRFARFVAAFALAMWLASSRDLYWGLRLDLLSSGFTHLQYQRFLIAAKPGFFLLAGAVVGALGHEARRRWQSGRRYAAVPLALIAAAGLAWIARDVRGAVQGSEVGRPQIERLPDVEGFDRHYDEFVAWARELDEQRRGRFAFLDQRNIHWFMDFTVRTGLPIYKAGFTPGDNFVHKPESDRREVLDAAGVKYVVRRGRPQRAWRGRHVQSFGPIHVYRHEAARATYPVELRGKGSLEVVSFDAEAGQIEVEVRGAEPGSVVVPSVAAFPRWSASVNDRPGEWIEVPVWGDVDPVNPTFRESGALRGGKADGDDGSEPTLVGVPVEGDATVELTYRARTPRDVLAGLLSLLSLLGLAVWIWRPPRAATHRIDGALRSTSPGWAAVPLALVLAVLAVRWSANEHLERASLHAALQRGEARTEGHAQPGPLKTDMLIRPAVVVPGRRSGVVYRDYEALPERLEGWVALDDDWAKARRGGRRTLTVRLADEEGPRLQRRLPHRPGRETLSIDLGDRAGQAGTLVVEVSADGKRAPRVGVELAAADPAPAPSAR